MSLSFGISNQNNGTFNLFGTAVPDAPSCSLDCCAVGSLTASTSTLTWTALNIGGTYSLSTTTNSVFGVTLAAGVYAFRLKCTDGRASFVYGRITNGTESLHYQCLQAVKTRLQELALSGMDSDNILVHEILDSRYLTKEGSNPTKLPGIIITPGGAEQATGGTNTRDDIAYPVNVFIVAARNQTIDTGYKTYLQWRQQCMAALRSQRLSGVSDQFNVKVEPGEIVNRTAWEKNFWASGFTVRFTCRETRGII